MFFIKYIFQTVNTCINSTTGDSKYICFLNHFRWICLVSISTVLLMEICCIDAKHACQGFKMSAY